MTHREHPLIASANKFKFILKTDHSLNKKLYLYIKLSHEGLAVLIRYAISKTPVNGNWESYQPAHGSDLTH